MITYCSGCGIANKAGDERCQACGRRLRQSRPGEVSVPLTTSAPEPFYIRDQRHRWAMMACRGLLSAALLSISRAMLMPFLVTHMPRGTFGLIDLESLRQNGYIAAVGFCIAAIWAQRDPVIPTVGALSLYLGLAVPDALDGTTLLSRGIISKSVMLLILVRALYAAIQSRTTRQPLSALRLHT